MMSQRCLVLAACVLLGTACANRETVVRCDDDPRYQQAYTTPPLGVPDDLSVPDETEAMRIPSSELGAPTPERCLELSPGFEEGLANSSPDGG